MATSWEVYLPEVLPWVPGCPESVALSKIRNSAIQFCERSTIWRADHAAINVAALTHTYDLVSPVLNARIHKVVHAAHDGYPLNEMSEDELDLKWPKLGGTYPNLSDSVASTPWRKYEADRANLYTQPGGDPTKIRLIGIPNTALVSGLEVKLALKPLPNAEDGDDRLYYDWYQQIAAGALAQLLAVPEEWADKHRNLFAHYSGLFEKGVMDATARAATGNVTNHRAVGRTRSYFR